MPRFDNLRSKLGGGSPQEEEQSLMDQGLDYLGRPGAAFRSGAYAAQTGQPIMEAIKKGFTNPSEQAPTGSDIADKFSEQTGVQNPYALAALATMGEMADPSALIPMVGPMAKIKNAEKLLEEAPAAAKAIKGMAQGERALSRVGDVSFPARSTAESMKIAEALKKSGRVPEKATLQVGERAPIEMKENLLGKDTLRKADLSKEELGEVMTDFPILRQLKKYGGSGR